MLAVVLISSNIVVWAVESRGTKIIVVERHDMGARSRIEGTHRHFVRFLQSMTLHKLVTTNNPGTHCKLSKRFFGSGWYETHVSLYQLARNEQDPASRSMGF